MHKFWLSDAVEPHLIYQGNVDDFADWLLHQRTETAQQLLAW